VTAAITAALRARAAGLYPDEVGTELLISHGGFLHRHDFNAFVHAGTSISDGTTRWPESTGDAALGALHGGQLPPVRRRTAHPPARRQHYHRHPRLLASHHPRPG